MSYKKEITKEEINQLPRYELSVEIELIEAEAAAIAAAKELEKCKVLGFDTETRAAFKKGENYDISLLQLAIPNKVYLFRINKFKLVSEITQILANPEIIKAGVAVRDDIKGLQKIRDFKDKGFIDLAKMAKEKEIKNFGLRALTAILLGKKLSKKEKISNWQRPELSNGQIHYAACDAMVGLEIYNKMNNL